MTSREDIYKFIGLHNQVKILIIFDESSSLDFVETELSVDFLTFHKVFSNFPTSWLRSIKQKNDQRAFLQQFKEFLMFVVKKKKKLDLNF